MWVEAEIHKVDDQIYDAPYFDLEYYCLRMQTWEDGPNYHGAEAYDIQNNTDEEI